MVDNGNGEQVSCISCQGVQTVQSLITILVDWALAMDNGEDGQQQLPTLLGMRGALPCNGVQW